MHGTIDLPEELELSVHDGLLLAYQLSCCLMHPGCWIHFTNFTLSFSLAEPMAQLTTVTIRPRDLNIIHYGPFR